MVPLGLGGSYDVACKSISLSFTRQLHRLVTITRKGGYYRTPDISWTSVEYDGRVTLGAIRWVITSTQTLGYSSWGCRVLV